MPVLYTPEQVRDALNAYRSFKALGGGTDRQFLAAGLLPFQLSEPTLRRWLATWRDRAARGLDPITADPDPNAKALLDGLGQASSAFQTSGAKSAQLQKQAKEQAKASTSATIDKTPTVLQPQDEEARRVRKAQRILDKVLRGDVVKPAQHKAAEQILLAAGKLGRKANEAKVKASEFTSWPTAALTELLTELGAVALVTRHDPAPPVLVVPAEERDAARLEEASGLPATTADGQQAKL